MRFGATPGPARQASHPPTARQTLQVYEAIDSRDGASCAELVSFKHPHVANPRLQMASPEEKCQQVLEPPYDEMFAAHLRCTYAVGNHDFIEAYKCQTVIVQYPYHQRAVRVETRVPEARPGAPAGQPLLSAQRGLGRPRRFCTAPGPEHASQRRPGSCGGSMARRGSAHEGVACQGPGRGGRPAGSRLRPGGPGKPRGSALPSPRGRVHALAAVFCLGGAGARSVGHPGPGSQADGGTVAASACRRGTHHGLHGPGRRWGPTRVTFSTCGGRSRAAAGVRAQLLTVCLLDPARPSCGRSRPTKRRTGGRGGAGRGGAGRPGGQACWPHRPAHRALPVMYAVALDLRVFANNADQQLVKKGRSKAGDMLEKAAELLMSCFRVCASDTRAGIEDSKKWGMLFLVNQLFKIYFKVPARPHCVPARPAPARPPVSVSLQINKLHLCKPLIRAIDSSNLKEDYSRAQRVTYRYYVGRKAMFDSDFKQGAPGPAAGGCMRRTCAVPAGPRACSSALLTGSRRAAGGLTPVSTAEEYLSFAFEHCHRSSQKNKRMILIYLLPVKMLLGHMPTVELLRKYHLMQFAEVTRAVSEGNLLLLNAALARHEAFFIRCGIFLILEKLKVITYRNLFKRVYLLLRTHQLSLDAFLVALKFMQVEDVDIDEVQCILANLIYMVGGAAGLAWGPWRLPEGLGWKRTAVAENVCTPACRPAHSSPPQGHIKGYISHQHQKLVVSKQNPFPPLSTVC
ncbi:PCI domain-containing protein 2 [Galemys pyrenaicus]|uniref:PCI domain-containing protein 2 n=1 Tax=Galemys pyrenaicus TaxID=202257 RepID=A0A8J6DTC8_GALPY|nr:PCI domain-containing protein 2 [Galemys pyrenaicus]